MRRLAYLLVLGVLAAGPASASDRDDVVEMLANAMMPACKRPIAQLSISEIDRCRRNLEWAREVGDRMVTAK